MILDAFLALTALLLMLPMLLMIAAIISLDSPGPVLFRQTRTGLNGRPFRIFKFRTMQVHDNESSVEQAKRNDLRVTRVGRFLRSTSIDELPQLLNVLRGEMALVGPRPHALAHDEHFGREITLYNRRFMVKPGLTGWAQVNGSRGETPTVSHMMQRVQLDLWYIENRSTMLDIRIIIKTLYLEISRRSGAY